MIYKFKCEKCGEIELSLPVSQCNLDVCPTCGNKIERVFSGLTPIWKCKGDYNGER